MLWTHDYLYERILARDASFNGRFLTGVLTTGIYCLPSCTARKPLVENVRFFEDETGAQTAGLRPCKRCRPDHFYRGEDPDLTALEDVMRRALSDPGSFPSVEALAGAAGVGMTKLKTLFRDHAHGQPATFLQRARIQAACTRLVEGRPTLSELGYDVGFESASGFHGAFRRQTGLSPGAYRTMLDSDRFILPLPEDARVLDLLRFHGRDPESLCERVEGSCLRKAFLHEGQALVLGLTFGERQVDVSLTGGTGPRSLAKAHDAALRLVGWHGDPGPFEAAHPGLVTGRLGMRVPLTLEPFEALVWAILGQQVNLPFAYALRRGVVGLAGIPAACGLTAHPDAVRVAALPIEALLAQRCSRRKAEYLIHASTQVASGSLSLDSQITASGAARALLALRGCGPWTAQYVLMRGLGFRDCVPVGDAGLTLALQRFFGLSERPDAEATQRLMAAYAPHRSLATFHLWASLKGVPA